MDEQALLDPTGSVESVDLLLVAKSMLYGDPLIAIAILFKGRQVPCNTGVYKFRKAAYRIAMILIRLC